VPSPFKELTGFASLARKHLAPHDTIHAVIRSEDGSHGVLELTWGLPSVSGSDLFRVVGSEGVLTVSRFNKKNEETGKDESFYKVEIVKGGSGAKEEIVEKSCGVLKELENFANHLSGNDDGLGSPLGALKDVSIIQAALDSNGSVIDLQKLVKGI
jgi:predicted dehydrogenase